MKVLSALLVAVAVFYSINLGNATDAEAQKAVVVQLTGSVPKDGKFKGGTFSGTFAIERFEAQGNQLKAVGMIAGVISGVGTVVHGPIALPATATALPATPNATGGPVIQQQEGCGVLHLQIGGVDVNLLGLVVTLSPVTLDIVGEPGLPLGDLVCEILTLLGTVADVVGLLNQLLALLLGLLGGLAPGA